MFFKNINIKNKKLQKEKQKEEWVWVDVYKVVYKKIDLKNNKIIGDKEMYYGYNNTSYQINKITEIPNMEKTQDEIAVGKYGLHCCLFPQYLINFYSPCGEFVCGDKADDVLDMFFLFTYYAKVKAEVRLKDIKKDGSPVAVIVARRIKVTEILSFGKMYDLYIQGKENKSTYMNCSYPEIENPTDCDSTKIICRQDFITFKQKCDTLINYISNTLDKRYDFMDKYNEIARYYRDIYNKKLISDLIQKGEEQRKMNNNDDNNNNKKYAIILNEKQLKIIIKACDLFTRLKIGQWNTLIDETFKFDWDKDDKSFLEKAKQKNKAVNYIYKAKEIVYPYLNTYASYSPTKNEDTTLSYEVEKCLRYYLAWDKNPKGEYTVDYFPPLHYSKEPLCEVKKIDENNNLISI